MKPKLIRPILKQLYGEKCYWCDKKLHFYEKEIKPHPHDMATIEHLIPLSQKGTNDLDNLRLACHDCNSRRMSLPKPPPIVRRPKVKYEKVFWPELEQALS